MKVLVTGGSGIVGHYVINELIENNHEVVNADKVRWGTLSHSGTTTTARADKALEMRKSWGKLPTFFEVDVTDYGQVISSMEGCDGVIHLAACPSAEYYTEELKKPIVDKIKAEKNQKYYTGGAIVLMFAVLIGMYLVLN